ncbi:TPA: hypothetical protein ACH3X3_005588 [Trebouxia sp. C0006]
MMLATPTTQATLQTAACQQTHRTLCQRNRRCSAACSTDQPCFRSPTPVDRRSVSLNLLGLLCQAAICVPALAKPSPSNKEVDDNTSALVQGLLAKSKANKDRYTKERLNDYYRRNFKVCSKNCLQFCPAACLAHDGVHCKGCRVHIDIEVHGGHCAELAQGNYLMPRVTCAL